MSLDIKYWRARFVSKIEDLDTQANLCRNFFYPATIIMTMEPSQWGNVLCDAKGSNNSIKLKKGNCKGIEDFLNCALTLSFFKLWNWRRFALHKMISLKWRKMAASTHKLSRFFAENASCWVVFQGQLSRHYFSMLQVGCLVVIFLHRSQGLSLFSIFYPCLLLIHYYF